MSRGRRMAAAVGVGAVTLAGWLAIGGRGFPDLAREHLPAEYVGRTNPLVADPSVVAAGAQLFRDNCASCHGERADGRGPAADGLDPPPANFTGSDVLATHSDAYLFYRMSVGKPGTAMPSFHGVLDERERWSLVRYLRDIDRNRRGVASPPAYLAASD